VTATAEASQQGAEEAVPPARWLWVTGYTAAAVLLFFCYLRISGTVPVTSDGASNALQAWDMLHGN
jgi:hypothetical protein